MDVRELVERVDFVGLVGKKTQLRESGGKLRGLSPFTNEKTPSFYVNPGAKTWYCFSLGAGGGVLDFIQRAEGLERREAVRFLSEYVGVSYAEESEEMRERRVALLMALDFFGAEKGPVVRYLVSRGLTEKTANELIKLYGLGYAPSRGQALLSQLVEHGVSEETILALGLGSRRGEDLIPRFENRLMIPVHNEYGILACFTGRDLTGKSGAKYLHGSFSKSKLVWGLKALRSMDELVVVEGPLDAMTLTHAGIPSVAILGASISVEQMKLVSKLSKNLYFALDGDNAGDSGIARAVEVAEELDVVIYPVRLPRGEDPDEYIKNRGAEAFKALLKEAESDTSSLVGALIKKHAGKGSKVDVAKKVLSEITFHRSFTHRSLDTIERIAQHFGLNPREVRDWAIRKEEIKTPRSSPGETFRAPIYERRILYSVLKEPALVSRVAEVVSLGDFSSHLVSKVLSLVEPGYTQAEIFDILAERLEKEELDAVLMFFSVGVPGAELETSLEVMKLDVARREGGMRPSFLRRPNSVEKEMAPIIKEALRGKSS